MARFRLEALAPKRYCVGRNADGTPDYKTFTADDCKNHAAKLNMMLAAKVPFPVCWEHRDDANLKRKLSRDQWASERALGTAGWLDKVELDKDSRVWTEIEIPDEADAKKAETLRFCSPQIEPDVIDGDGTNWGQAFVHLALTPKPIHQHQQPIQRMSKDGVATTVESLIRLSVDATSGQDTQIGGPQDVLVSSNPVPPQTSQIYFDQCKPLLAKKGINLPDDTNILNFFERLYVLLNASTTEDDENIQPISPQGTGPGPLAMSQAAASKEQVKAEAFRRENITARIDALLTSKRITKAMADKLKTEAGTVKLSWSDAGEREPSTLEAKLEAYEELEENAALPPDERVKLSRQDIGPAKRPKHATLAEGETADDSPEARKARMEGYEAMTGSRR